MVVVVAWDTIGGVLFVYLIRGGEFPGGLIFFSKQKTVGQISLGASVLNRFKLIY